MQGMGFPKEGTEGWCVILAHGQNQGKDDETILKFHGHQGLAALPIVLYVVIAGVIALGFHYYGMKAMTFAAIISLIIGFLLCKNKKEYWSTGIRGLADFGNARLILVFIVIAIFSKVLVSGDIGGGFVWVSIHLGLSGGAFTVFAFLGCTIIAMGAGAPFPALLALVPLFYPAGVMLGADPAMLIGSMISGVFFGDACSPSSQVIHTTIASQHDAGTHRQADLIEIMKARLPYLGVIALISVVLFYFLGGSATGAVHPEELASLSNPRGLLMLLPILILLIVCFKTRDLFLGVTWGTLAGIVVGFASGIFQPSDIVSIDAAHQQMSGIFSDGIANSTDIVFSTLLLFGLIQVAIEGGVLAKGCEFLLHLKMARKTKGAETIIALAAGIVNILLAGAVLPSILMVKEVADTIGQESGVSANRRSILLTAMTTNITSIIPLNSSFIMGSITLVAEMAAANPSLPLVSPFQIFIASIYPLLLTVLCFVWIAFGLCRAQAKKAKIRNKLAPDNDNPQATQRTW